MTSYPPSDVPVLYGAGFSLYSGKARSYLRKKEIPFEERLSTYHAYKNFIEPRTGVRFIPVLQLPNDTVLQDTTVIIDALEKIYPEHSVYPGTPKQRLAALLLEVFGDEWLVNHAMYYRWSFPDENRAFLNREFGEMLFPGWPGFIQRFIGRRMANRFAGYLPALGITEATKSAWEARFNHLLTALEAHFQEHEYLLGGRPCVGDFGFIGSFYAHLYRDPYSGHMLRRDAPAVTAWVERMVEPGAADGSWISDDAIPDTLQPVLKHMADEQIPVLMETQEIVDQWTEQNPDQPLPRRLGDIAFSIGNATASRNILPHSLWMWQRPRDFYQSLSPAERQELDHWLAELDLLNPLRQKPRSRIYRKENRIYSRPAAKNRQGHSSKL